MKRKRNDLGLTLIEVLIGISITAVLFVILLAALRLGHSSGEKGKELQDVSQRVRIVSDRLAWLLRGAYPYVVEKPEGKIFYFSGSPSRVGFVTTSMDSYSDSPEDASGLKWVDIYVDGDGLKVKEKLFYGEDVFDKQGGKEFVLEKGVKELRFSYLDAGENGNLDTWATVWEPKEKSYLPSAVRVELSLEQNGKKTDFPPIVAVIRGGRVIR